LARAGAVIPALLYVSNFRELRTPETQVSENTSTRKVGE
jgi:hypothetical protein